MDISRNAGIGGSMPQQTRMPDQPGGKPLFHSVREIALILDKTFKAGYGVLKIGTLMSECSITGNLYPYPQADADINDTNAKAYLVASAGSSATVLYVGIEDSYKFNVADELILDGSGAGTTEVQSMAEETLAESDVYTLTYGGVTLTSTAMGGSPTTAELVAALTGGDNATAYAAMPFTLSAGSSAVTITWKAIGVATLCTSARTTGTALALLVTQTTAGTAFDMDTVDAENLGAITAIDRTAVNSTQAKITFTTAITNYANFTTGYYGHVYVKSADEASTPFAGAKYILDKDIDTGVGVYAVGANSSVVISNAILYRYSLVGFDSAAATDLGTTTDGRFVILK